LIPDASVLWPDPRIEVGWLQDAPLIAVEIASRGNPARELEKKRLLDHPAGAAEVRFIDPDTHRMMVSRPDGTVIAIDPAAGYRCALIPWW